MGLSWSFQRLGENLKLIVATFICLGILAGPCPSRAGVRESDSVRDLGRTVTDIGRDAGHIYTSPLRMGRGGILKLGGILAVGALLYANDEEIYESLHDHQYDDWYKPFRDLGDFFEPIGHMGNSNKYYIGALAVGYIGGHETLKRASFQLLESHLIGGFLNNTVQMAVGRQRPYGKQGPYSFGNKDATSFMSGHASNYFQDLAIITHHVDNAWFTRAAYLTGVAVVFQRVTSSQHWASDAFISAFYGHAVGRAIVERHEGRSASPAEIAPVLLDGAPGLACRVKF